MIALEVIAAVVLAALLGTATWMAGVGLLAAVGAVGLKRCRVCGHLHAGVPTAPRATGAAAVCLYCRHPRLARVMPVRLHHFLPAEMDPQPVSPPPVGAPGTAH